MDYKKNFLKYFIEDKDYKNIYLKYKKKYKDLKGGSDIQYVFMGAESYIKVDRPKDDKKIYFYYYYIL